MLEWNIEKGTPPHPCSLDMGTHGSIQDDSDLITDLMHKNQIVSWLGRCFGVQSMNISTQMLVAQYAGC